MTAMKVVSVKTLVCLTKLWGVIGALFLISGCQSVSIQSRQEIGGQTFPPTNPDTVQILRTEPTRPHTRLGEIRAEPSDEDVSASKIEEALRKAAAKLGADAAVVVCDRNQVVGAYVTGPWYGRSIERVEERVVYAVAIKYQ